MPHRTTTSIKSPSSTMFYQITHYPNQSLLHLHLGGDFDWQHYLRASRECGVLFESILEDTALIVSIDADFSFNSDDLMKNADRLTVQQPENLTSMVVVGLPPQHQVAYQVFTHVYNRLRPQQIFSVDKMEDALALIHPIEDTMRIS